ncbi:unnamed protein product [Hermetia illucens]|uniref:Uncharacterized protein n=1 Tax=Hermetia illucens TaxID=343691 RepID=A0A7R8YQA5_HERIL|nr:uncharacterized protein LOC119661623 [Hermetia illucens]CAD7080280.1 unnamed protein product [Hermetia illucens]
MHKIAGFFILVFGCSQALIVPQELPSILSLVYSNIPPIKKGTDSRLGFGFRLGEHADFQVMLELGPQTETRKIGGVSANKRQVDRNHLGKINTNETTNREAAAWLTNWSNDITSVQKKRKKALTTHKKPTTTTTSTTIRTVPLVSEEALKQLQQLYKSNTKEGTVDGATVVTNQEIIPKRSSKDQMKITEELMDVNLE